jgi:tetratricopeptide (TPR) repeat protein
MPFSKLEADVRKFRWEASKRARRTGRIKAPQVKRALNLHVAGRYEDAIAVIESIPVSDRSAEAWRVLGHAEHGRGNFDMAVEAHRNSRRLHSDNASAAAEDEENLAAVFSSMRKYDAAWQATERAFRLSPHSLMAWIAKISILNRQQRRDELRTLLCELLAEKPDVLENSRFIDHLRNDTDFIGVNSLVQNMGYSQRELNHVQP